MSKKEKTSSTSHKILSVIGAILCVILIPILVVNVTLIVKSYTDKDKVPSFGGYLPMIILSESMAPDINSGDLIICHTIEPEEIKEGDIISFFDPDGNGTSVVTHRVIAVNNENNSLTFKTRGDANNTDDRTPVPADSVIGIYKKCIPNAGEVAMFMQTTPGLIVCVVCPLVLLVAYDIIRRRQYDKSNKKDAEALLQELERLKAEKENYNQH